MSTLRERLEGEVGPEPCTRVVYVDALDEALTLLERARPEVSHTRAMRGLPSTIYRSPIKCAPDCLRCALDEALED